jgi:predicted AAA+ superfamily ATPase
MIRRDFVDFFHVRDTKTLERTIRIVAQNTGRILSERKLCTDLGVALNTVRNHIGFLEKAYIVFAARVLARSVSSQSRISEKLFFLDPGLRNSLVGYQIQDKGGLLESAVYVHLWSFFKKHRPSVELLYWRKKDVEVDIVLRQGKALIGIEVHASDDDVHGLKQFLEEKPSALGILVSDAQPPNAEDRIIVIPPHLLFLL